MESHAHEIELPRFRNGVIIKLQEGLATISLGTTECSFEFPRECQSNISRLLSDLEVGGFTISDLSDRAPRIAEQLHHLIDDFSELRLITESQTPTSKSIVSGTQLYRELRRIAERVIDRVAHSSFYRALVDNRAERNHLLGYGLEYYWIVRSAPGLIAPTLASAHSPKERALLEEFLSTELGHDKFIAQALEAVGLSRDVIDRHQPLPATFAIGASLGVYARQHPLSFKACLFVLEEGRPEFVDAFDKRCKALGLPSSFYLPFREHADLNSEYDHADISGDLLGLEEAIDSEACAVVKRHLSLLIETMVQQEEQILNNYGSNARLPRIFE